jgi:hypothetical protein
MPSPCLLRTIPYKLRSKYGGGTEEKQSSYNGGKQRIRPYGYRILLITNPEKKASGVLVDN